eukprot:gene26553-18321_t
MDGDIAPSARMLMTALTKTLRAQSETLGNGAVVGQAQQRARMNDTTPAELGVRSKLLVDKHAHYIASFSKLWEIDGLDKVNTEKMEFVATEHFWMSGLYWGLTAMHLLGRLDEMDETAILEWLQSCQHENGGFGGSARNDPHLLYTLSAVQILALYDRLDLIDADKITKCEYSALSGDE